MITADDLFETSTKRRCEITREAFVAAGQEEEHDRVRRHADTCLSRVLSIEEADKLWEDRHSPPSLLGDMGMCVYAHGDPLSTDMVFVTDDSNYGWKVLKAQGWMAMSFRSRGTAHQTFVSWRDHLAHYYKGARVLESLEDLLAELNRSAAMVD